MRQRMGFKKRDTRRPSCPSGHLAVKFAEKFAACRLTSYSKLYLSLIQSKDWVGLMGLPQPRPHGYDCVETFRHDWALYNLLRKYLGFGVVSRAQRASAAIEDFVQGDEACKVVNERLASHLMASDKALACGIPVDAFIMSVRRKISSVVPAVPSKADLVGGFRLSSGASWGLPKKHGKPNHKLTPPFEVTPSAVPYLEAFLRELPHSDRLTNGWGAMARKLVAWNEVDTVEKNSLKGRTIGKEPAINMGFQLSVGGILKRCFSARGPTNMYQQETQNALARKGSLDGTLATEDLKNASNSTALVAVELTWPPGWVALFNDLRCHYYRLPSGEVGRYGMLSSMGNGFTFEVLSITIWAIAAAICDLLGVDTSGRIGIFGDDLICPSEAILAVREGLSFFGYESNPEKSFYTGPFRESCGKHYFRGVDVTPFYIDEKVSSRQQKYWLANAVRLWSSKWGTEAYCDARYKACWDYLRANIPRALAVPYTPPGVLDGLLLGRSELGNSKPGYLVAVNSANEPSRYHYDEASYAQWLISKTPKGGIRSWEHLRWLGPNPTEVYLRSWWLRKLHLDPLFHVEAYVASQPVSESDATYVSVKDATLLIHWTDPPMWC